LICFNGKREIYYATYNFIITYHVCKHIYIIYRYTSIQWLVSYVGVAINGIQWLVSYVRVAINGY